jgi:hypothetical protein
MVRRSSDNNAAEADDLNADNVEDHTGTLEEGTDDRQRKTSLFLARGAVADFGGVSYAAFQ